MEDTEYIEEKEFFLTKKQNNIIPYRILYKKV